MAAPLFGKLVIAKMAYIQDRF